MAVSMQVMYPITEGTTFDYDYYFSTHMDVVGEHWGEHIQSTLVTKGLAGGAGAPPGLYAIATIIFADEAALEAARNVGGPVLGDIPNFTNVRPQVLIGEVMG